MSEQYQQYTPEVTSDDKLWTLLAYIFSPIVPVILLLMEDKKNRPFIKAHNVQALVWGVVIYVLTGVLSFVIVGFCIGVAGLILSIYWGIQAYNGKYVEIPVITNFVKSRGWA